MRFNKTFAVAAGAAAALAFASVVAAQTPPAAARPAAPVLLQPKHGPAIPGVCTYDAGKAMKTSEVGKYVIGRLTQIAAEANAELQAEDTAIKNEARAIDAAGPTLTADAREKRGADLQVRYNANQRKKQLRQAEVQQTENKAFMRIAQELDPIAVGVYQARNCAILLGEGVMLSNPAMDITDQVILGLNAKIKSFTFNRERLDTPAAPPRAN